MPNHLSHVFFVTVHCTASNFILSPHPPYFERFSRTSDTLNLTQNYPKTKQTIRPTQKPRHFLHFSYLRTSICSVLLFTALGLAWTFPHFAECAAERSHEHARTCFQEANPSVPMRPPGGPPRSPNSPPDSPPNSPPIHPSPHPFPQPTDPTPQPHSLQLSSPTLPINPSSPNHPNRPYVFVICARASDCVWLRFCAGQFTARAHRTPPLPVLRPKSSSFQLPSRFLLPLPPYTRTHTHAHPYSNPHPHPTPPPPPNPPPSHQRESPLHTPPPCPLPSRGSPPQGLGCREPGVWCAVRREASGRGASIAPRAPAPVSHLASFNRPRPPFETLLARACVRPVPALRATPPPPPHHQRGLVPY